MISIKNVSKEYKSIGQGGTKALDNVSLELPRGEIVGIFGENGAGKTTLMKSILGLQSHKGEILLDGKAINNENICTLAFATCEHSFFAAITAKAHREFYESHFPKFRGKRFDGLMEFFELPMNKRINSFSAGQKNQFEVILALSQGADYIFMDEPFAGNDVFNREDFYKVLLGILEENETVILSTHLLEEVEKFIGRAVLIHKGSVVGDCTTEELEMSGKSLMSYVKEVYRYQNDRVSRALEQLTEEE
ncbi:MAG: ABC transporter ATP-binding protein [Eubacteriales bacterium]